MSKSGFLSTFKYQYVCIWSMKYSFRLNMKSQDPTQICSKRNQWLFSLIGKRLYFSLGVKVQKTCQNIVLSLSSEKIIRICSWTFKALVYKVVTAPPWVGASSRRFSTACSFHTYAHFLSGRQVHERVWPIFSLLRKPTLLGTKCTVLCVDSFI